MGLLKDGPEGRRRLCWALIFTACYSRHLFCWLSFRQTLPEVIEGCDQAWRFFGGVFGVIIPRLAEGDRDRGRPHRAALQPGLPGVRPSLPLRDRPGSDPAADR